MRLSFTEDLKVMDRKRHKKLIRLIQKQPKDIEKNGIYSGRTSGTKSPEQNVRNRDVNHHMNETRKPTELDKTSSLVRGREQQLINQNDGAKSQGGTSGNKVNGVSPKNPNAQKYDDAVQK